MKVLVFQNHPCEDAGTAGTAFEDYGAEVEVIECFKSRRAPDVSGDVLLVLGGPMNVYEEKEHPFLRWETEWIHKWAEEGRPVLGLCLGAQLLSKATGGKISKNEVPEIGHYEVQLTEAGMEDPIFSGIKNPVPVIQWHQDTFTVPPGGILLATGSACTNQAFRIFRAIGLQFHLEIGRDKMSAWIDEYVRNPAEEGIDVEGIMETFTGKEATYASVCTKLIQNFCRYDIAGALTRNV
jgi:GMP synthase (glutamine-hydrolysing)